MFISKLRRDEEGAILAFVLVFLALFGIFIALLLGLVEANFRTGQALQGRGARTYDADAGIDYAIEALRGSSYEECPEIGVTGTVVPPADYDPNGRAIQTECETLDGGLGLGIHLLDRPAIVTTSTDSDSIETQGPPGKTVVVEGPDTGKPTILNSGGFDFTPQLSVLKGHVWQKSHCVPGGPIPAGLNVGSPYNWECKPAELTNSHIDPRLLDPLNDYALPSSDLPMAPGPDDLSADCRRFYPGRYTSPPSLLARNYFVSGVYQFDAIGTWNISSAEVFGGRPLAPEKQVLSRPSPPLQPCSSDSGVASALGYGVTFILTGQSKLEVRNNTWVELFSRFATDNPDLTTPDEPTIYAVPSFVPPPPLDPWQPNPGDSRSVQVGATGGGGGSGINVAVHGLTFAYDSDVEAFAGATISQSNLLGGAVARKILLQLSATAPANSPGISSQKFRQRPTSRTLLIKSVAAGKEAESNFAIQAVVVINNKNHPTAPLAVDVQSWRNCETGTC